MPVIQPSFYVPAEEYAKYLAGDYTLELALRNAIGPKKGKFAAMFKEIDTADVEGSKEIIYRIVQTASKHKKSLIIVGCTAAVGTIAYGSYRYAKNKYIRNFDKIFHEYLEALQTKSLSIELIEKMEVALDEIKNHYDLNSVNVSLSMDELNVILNSIEEYTKQLASSNSVIIETDNTPIHDHPLIKLHRNIINQKAVFSVA